MKLTDIYESKNPHYKPGEPYWELDVENKVYTVHQPDGTEVSRHTFQHVWDSSPAMRKAKEDYNKLYKVYYEKKKADDYTAAQSKPLSNLEEKYYKLSTAVKNYAKYIWPKTPEDDFLDKETRDLYLETANKWLEEMNRYSANGTVRASLINGTYKPPQ
jgi:hypothetical protein